jgi:hypothetical protein
MKGASDGGVAPKQGEDGPEKVVCTARAAMVAMWRCSAVLHITPFRYVQGQVHASRTNDQSLVF